MLNNTTPCIVDLETFDLTGKKIWCCGFATDARSWCVEWDDASTPAYIEELAETYTLVFHNAKFDVRVLREHDTDIKLGSYHDTMIMSYVWNTRRIGGHGLASWGNELGYRKMDYRQACIDAGLLDPKTPRGAEHRLPYDNLKRDYCIRDCEVTLRLWHKLMFLFSGDSKATKLLLEIELPMIDAIIEMETTGFYVDKVTSLEMLDTLTIGCDALRSTMKDIIPFVPGKEVVYKTGFIRRKIDTVVEQTGTTKAGKPKTRKVDTFNTTYSHCTLVEFNPNSGAQVADALTSLYGWVPSKLTPSGAPCTDADTLSSLTDYPLAVSLCEYSTINKMHGMTTGYLEFLGEGRRLFSSFNQCVTKTGRLSSSDPNVQNIPANGVWGDRMRSLFTSPGDGWKMVGCDLSNIEGRVLAHYLSLVCNENRMTDTFAAGVDFHQANADAWGLPRQQAKTGLYALLYGAGAASVGKGDAVKGQAIMDSIYEGMPAIKALKEMVWKRCADNNGLVYDAFGRRLNYPEINESGATEAALRVDDREGKTVKQVAKGFMAQAKRQVFNALLQGTAASVLKKIVLLVALYQDEYNAHLCANVHDEALYYTPVGQTEGFAARVTKTFSTPLLSNCPIMGVAKIGDNWNAIH